MASRAPNSNNTRHSQVDRLAFDAQKQWKWVLALMLLAPLELGAKGCDVGVVGDECPEGAELGSNPNCGAAGQAGQPSTDPGPQKDCGGLLGVPCAEGQYCSYALEAQCGAADQTGVCVAMPTVCADVYDPVCGCDDKTYSNACEAAGAGVSVARKGECNPTAGGTDCGGLLGLSCDKGEYCNYPPDAQCGAADQTGVCAPIPSACIDVYKPVCGCDDKTYGNDCDAAAAGVSVLHEGECKPTSGGDACGGLLGLACETGEYCNYPSDAQCGIADQTGICEPLPEACDTVYDPVCGCNGKTYGNSCEAAMNGVSVASKGECEPSGTTCGTRGAASCAEGEYCNHPLDADCGRADAPGVCAAKPEACTKELNQVCGCNGITYGNPCMAASAGVSVDYMGACK